MQAFFDGSPNYHDGPVANSVAKLFIKHLSEAWFYEHRVPISRITTSSIVKSLNIEMICCSDYCLPSPSPWLIFCCPNFFKRMACMLMNPDVSTGLKSIRLSIARVSVYNIGV